MNALEIYLGSNGKATTALYEHLQSLGPAGIVALNLFRACKCSERAKVYSRRYKGDAYGRKQWSVDNLCKELSEHLVELGIIWGWKLDPNPPEGFPWVLYVDLPNVGQVSFHAAVRGSGPEYPREWDGKPHGTSAQNAIRFVQMVLDADLNGPISVYGN